MVALRPARTESSISYPVNRTPGGTGTQAYRPASGGSNRTEGVVVTLINTDGLAFIGPGSEWFWTALQFVALATTFYAIYRQLQAQHLEMQENTNCCAARPTPTR